MAAVWSATALGRRHSAVHADTLLRRCVDLAVAALLLSLLLPVMLLVALLVRHDSPGPAVYRQQRVGRDGRPFAIWKFRTMVADADRIGPAVSGRTDPRITALGRRLRSCRLDELPQLVNLLRGEMTLIGPRPEVPRFLSHYTPRERELLRVRPGILGPGALLFAFEQCDELCGTDDPDAYYVAHHLHPKLALDLAYLANRRLRTDMDLVLRAALVVIGKGH